MSMIVNITSYQFVFLADLPGLKVQCQDACEASNLKGSILLSPEGINLSVAGEANGIASFKQFLWQDPRFQNMVFLESVSEERPFKRLKIKLKKEIISLRQRQAGSPIETPANSLSPFELKQWLDEKRSITLLDTRNDYEVKTGTFNGAIHLDLQNFCEFPEAIPEIPQDKPIVMFCTGGIRCEKAALYLLEKGYREIYQLKGGILNYFQQVGREHYSGECYVFDERTTINTEQMLKTAPLVFKGGHR